MFVPMLVGQTVDMDALAFLTDDVDGLVVVRVAEVDGVLVDVATGAVVDLVRLVLVVGLPALEDAR